jgi:hypothetical protein
MEKIVFYINDVLVNSIEVTEKWNDVLFYGCLGIILSRTQTYKWAGMGWKFSEDHSKLGRVEIHFRRDFMR